MNDTRPVVFVVDDDDAVRRALSRVIRSAGCHVEAFASASDFLSRGPVTDCVACLLLDLQLPDLNGLALQRTLNAMDVPPSIVFISGHGDIPLTVDAMKAGAIDFLVKPVDDTVLLKAIEVALRHASDVRASRIERDSIRNRFDRLTAREREVLALVVKGRVNKQVAYELGVAEKTIKVHRGRVMQKMQARSLVELLRMSDKAGVPRSSHQCINSENAATERRPLPSSVARGAVASD
jgi:FixJ family two-component response regulator